MREAPKQFALFSMLLIGFFNIAFAQTSSTQTSSIQTQSFSKLVVFGDSISDTGNLAIIDLPPPFFENRISNGPVLVDFIASSINSNADRLGHLLGPSAGFNYAVYRHKWKASTLWNLCAGLMLLLAILSNRDNGF